MRRLAAWLALGALAVLLVEISCVSPKDEAKQRDVTRTPRQISQRYTSQSTDPYYTAIRSKYCYQQTPYRRNHPTYAGFTKINSGCEKENIQVTPCLCPCTRERINFKNGEYIVVNTDAFTNDDETNNNPNQCASQGETITNLNTNARTKEVSSERSSLENSGNPLGSVESTTGIESITEGYKPQSSVSGLSSPNTFVTSATGGNENNKNGGITTGAEYSLPNQPGVNHQTGALPGNIGSTTGFDSNGYNTQSSVGGSSSSNAQYTSSTGGGVPNLSGGMTTGAEYSLTNQQGVDYQTGAVPGKIGSTTGINSNVEGYNPQSSVGGPSSSNAYYTSSTGGGVPNINGGMTTGAEYSLTNQPGVDYQTGAVPGKIGSTTGINSNVEGYNPQSSVGGPSSSNAYYTSSTGGGVPNINGGMTTGAGYSLTYQPGVNHQTGAVTGNIGSTSGFGSNGYNPLSSSSNGYYTSTTGGEVPNKNGGFPGKLGDATLIGSGLSGYNSQILTANGKKQGSGPSSLDHKLQNVNVKNSGYKYEGIFNDDTKPKTLQPTHVSNIYGYKYERHLPMFTNNDFYPSNSLNNQPEVNSQTEAVPETLRGEKGSHFTIEGYTPKTSVEGSSSSNTLVSSTTRGGVSNTNGGMTTGAEYSLTNQPGENHQTGAVPGDIGSTSGFDSKGYNPQSSVGGSSSSNAYYTSSTGGGVPNKNGGMTTGAEYSLTNQPGVNYQSGAVLGYMGSTTGFDSTSLGYNTENKQTYDSGVGASSSSSAQLAGKGQLLLKNRSPSQQINQQLGYPDYSKTFQKKINSRGVTSKYHSTGYNYEVNPKDQSTNGNVLNTPVSNRYGYNFETNSPIPTGTSQEYWTTLSDQQCIDYPFGGLTSKGVTANPNVKGNMAEGLPKSNQPTGDQSNYEQSFAPTPGASDSPTTTQGTMLLDKSYSKNGIEMKTHDASVPKTESTETLSRGSNGELSTSERELTSGETAGPGKSQNGPSYEAKESTSQRKTTDLTNEDENEKIVSINGYSMKKSQLQYIIDSFKTPEKCILTLPQVFSGPLDRYAHVMKSYPSSVNANQGFIHIQESDLIVPYNCYKSIAETYAPDCPLFADAPGIMLPSGHYVEPSTLGNILASVKTPQEVMVVTPTGHAVPNTVYTKYIQGISSQDKKQLKVMIPNEKNTIPFEVYEEVLNKFTSEPSVDDKHDKGTIRLLGSNVEMPLDQFLEILNSYCNIKQATVTLPSQQSLQLVSFLQIAKILGEDYTKQCIVNIPNTDIKVSFTILAEIYKTYLENKPLDLSKDTDVNFNTPRAENQFDFADEQEEEENPEFETSGRKCYPTYRQSRRNRNGNRRQYYNPRSKYYQRAGSEFVRYPTLCSYPTDYPVPTPFEDPDGLCDSRCALRTYRTQRLQSSY